MTLQIVLISGCSSGIGLATAVHLAKDAEKRFKVYATMRNLAKKGKLEEEGKEQLGDTLIIKQMDVCSDESVTKAVKEVLDAEGKIDVLFNNAGMGLFSVVECVPVDMAKELFEVNFFGTLRLIQAVLPSMKARQSGHIINNSSHYGIVGMPFLQLYSASKFAMEGLTEAMAPTLLQFNIRCSLLEPGPVLTSPKEDLNNWHKKYEKSACDEKSSQLFQAAQEKMWKKFGDVMQQVNEVADFVKKIILSEKPNLRYQTNEKFNPDEVKAKLADPTGNVLVDLMNKKYF
ncbi:hypothetical protein ABFA07_012330 [Porites harrisoni]